MRLVRGFFGASSFFFASSVDDGGVVSVLIHSLDPDIGRVARLSVNVEVHPNRSTAPTSAAVLRVPNAVLNAETRTPRVAMDMSAAATIVVELRNFISCGYTFVCEIVPLLITLSPLEAYEQIR